MQAPLGANSTSQRYRTNFIEWDDTPSFAGALSQSGPAHEGFECEDAAAAGAHCGDTVPSALLPLMPSTPFREPLSGLAVREVLDADVFRHFFGR